MNKPLGRLHIPVLHIVCMSLESPCLVRSVSPSFGQRCLAEQFNAPAASVLRHRYNEFMAPPRAKMYDRAHITSEIRANDHQVAMARARREVVAAELQFAENRLKEAETLVQLRQHEVLITKLSLQEADENIGWTLEHYRLRKLYRLAQDPTLAKTTANPPYSPSIAKSDISSCTSRSTNSEAADASHEFSQVADVNGTGGAKDGGLGAAVPLTAAALKEHEQLSQDGSI